MNTTAASLSTRPARLSDIPLERLAGADAPESDKVRELSRQFEAVLVRQILTEARKPVFNSKFTDNSAAGQIYQGMMNDKLADSISSSGMLGLGRSMEKQLVHQVSSRDDGKISAKTPKAAHLRAAHDS